MNKRPWRPWRLAVKVFSKQVVAKRVERLMQDERLLMLLELLAADLEIPVRYADISTDEIRAEGGSCLLRGARQIILERGLGVKQKVRLLAAGLAELNLDGMFLLPAVREAVEAARAGEARTSVSLPQTVSLPPGRSGGRESRSRPARGRTSGRPLR